jgi:hypothetical protein
MAIDFKVKISELRLKDKSKLTEEEEGFIKIIEDYIDTQINSKLSTDKLEVWIEKNYVSFIYNPLTKKNFPEMTMARRAFLREELLSRYEKANWKINWYQDDGLDGPNMSGGDYLILKGVK